MAHVFLTTYSPSWDKTLLSPSVYSFLDALLTDLDLYINPLNLYKDLDSFKVTRFKSIVSPVRVTVHVPKRSNKWDRRFVKRFTVGIKVWDFSEFPLTLRLVTATKPLVCSRYLKCEEPFEIKGVDELSVFAIMRGFYLFLRRKKAVSGRATTPCSNRFARAAVLLFRERNPNWGTLEQSIAVSEEEEFAINLKQWNSLL